MKNQKDLVSGLMFSAVGIAFAVGATNYSLGTGARMGPGYFPMMLGVVLAILGAAITVTAVTGRDTGQEGIGAIAWKPLACVIGSNVVFGLLLGGVPLIGLPSMGMIVALYALVFIASLAADTFSFKAVALLATLLAIGSYLIFVKLLNLQFQVWPAFIN